MKSKLRFINTKNLILACMVAFGTILCSCSEQLADDVVPKGKTGDRIPISLCVSEKQDSVKGDVTRAITYIGIDNFKDVVKQLKVSAFKEDGSIYINAATFQANGKSGTSFNGSGYYFVSGDESYYWPEDNSKLKFIVWYGNGISVDDKGSISYNVKDINDNEEDCLLYESDKYISSGQDVKVDLCHTCTSLTFQDGIYFHPKTAIFNGTALDISNGKTILLPINGNEYWKPYTDKAIPLPDDKREYLNIEGYWDQAEFSRNMNFYIPFTSFNVYDNTNDRGIQFNYIYLGTKYNLKFNEMAPYLGYKADGTPNWITDIPVDLGLSVMWSRANLGAEDAYPTGLLYAWAETESKGTDPKNFTKENYKYYDASTGNVNVYPTNSYPFYKKGELYGYDLEDKDDPATKRLGKGWRLPTHDEFSELFNDKITNDSYRFTSKINNNYIEFNKFRNGSSVDSYETSSRYDALVQSQADLQFINSKIYYNGSNAYFWKGLPVRPVYDITVKTSGVTVNDWKPNSK